MRQLLLLGTQTPREDADAHQAAFRKGSLERVQGRVLEAFERFRNSFTASTRDANYTLFGSLWCLLLLGRRRRAHRARRMDKNYFPFAVTSLVHRRP